VSKAIPPLQPFHPEFLLSPAKLDKMEQQTNQVLIQSLAPGQIHSLKARPDGTILDGHHRIYVLRKSGVDVDSLPREIIEKEL
jgi:hypothetical protein